MAIYVEAKVRDQLWMWYDSSIANMDKNVISICIFDTLIYTIIKLAISSTRWDVKAR